jgi:hypothetical protein
VKRKYQLGSNQENKTETEMEVKNQKLPHLLMIKRRQPKLKKNIRLKSKNYKLKKMKNFKKGY